jgi:hypothetical protein
MGSPQKPGSERLAMEKVEQLEVSKRMQKRDILVDKPGLSCTVNIAKSVVESYC